MTPNSPFCFEWYITFSWSCFRLSLKKFEDAMLQNAQDVRSNMDRENRVVIHFIESQCSFSKGYVKVQVLQSRLEFIVKGL